MAQNNELAQAFAEYYYQNFLNNREELASLYLDSSLMTFEGEFFKGKEQIMTKLRSLPANIKRVLTTADCQNLDETFAIVFILGQLQSDNDPPHGFAETFLLKNVDGKFFILNSFFRLILHNH